MSEQLIPGAFRVFDVDLGEYVTDCEFFTSRDGSIWYERKHYFEAENQMAVIKLRGDSTRILIERFTGIYDRDGKPVYEGDIVFYGGGPASNPENVLTVKYHQENGFTGFVLQDYWGSNMGMLSILTHRPTIGTIHDSPEALAAAAKAVSQ